MLSAINVTKNSTQ